MSVIRLLVLMAAGVLLCQSCVNTPGPLTGENEYIITVPLPKNQPALTSSAAVKVYLSAGDWQIPLTIRKSIRDLRDVYGFTIVDSWPLPSIDEFCVVVRTDDPDAVEQMRSDPRVVSIQLINQFVTMKATPPYDDEKLQAQLGQNVEALNRLHRWSTGKDVKVGIIDTSIDRRHPDLEARIHHQDVFVSETPDADDLVHGTAVAGIIGAQADNGIGVVGFAPDSELYSYAACYHRGDWGKTVCNTFSLAKALAAATRDRIQVLNLSLAGPDDLLLERLLDALMDRGTIVVASDNPDNRAMRFPASLEHVIAVGRLDQDRQSSPPLIRTEDEHLTTRSGGSWQFFYGTSMSAARVTALIALLLERDPGINGAATRQSLANIIENCHGPGEMGGLCAMKFALTRRNAAVTLSDSR